MSVVVVEGLSDLGILDELPDDIVRAARMAVNRTTDRARTASSREIRNQVAFKARYLSSAEGRLQAFKAQPGKDIVGRIVGRGRPTSLARFAKGSPGKKGGVMLTVNPGSAKRMKRAFLMNLHNGNVGLAIRLREGESPKKFKAKRDRKSGVFFLFGPSVDQVFDDVADDLAPETADFLQDEFSRLLDVDW